MLFEGLTAEAVAADLTVNTRAALRAWTYVTEHLVAVAVVHSPRDAVRVNQAYYIANTRRELWVQLHADEDVNDAEEDAAIEALVDVLRDYADAVADSPDAVLRRNVYVRVHNADLAVWGDNGFRFIETEPHPHDGEDADLRTWMARSLDGGEVVGEVVRRIRVREAVQMDPSKAQTAKLLADQADDVDLGKLYWDYHAPDAENDDEQRRADMSAAALLLAKNAAGRLADDALRAEWLALLTAAAE